MSIDMLCEFITETDDVVLIETADGERTWVPLSQIDKMEKKKQFDGTFGKIRVTNTFARKAGWIHD